MARELPALSLVCALSLLTALGMAQGDVRLSLTGSAVGDEFGSIVSYAGDVNRDGYADVIVGAPYDATAGAAAGKATIFSGFDGSVIRSIYGTAGQTLGFSVCDAGDIDGDGWPDVIVGMSANGSTGLGPGGGARVISGASGSIIYTFAGQSLNDYFGLCMANLGDLNGDGVPDFIIGTSIPPTSTLPGYARVYSGATGTVLHAFNGSFVGQRFGNAVANAGDVDGDGVNDIIIGAIGGNLFGGSTGSAFVYSGATFALLWTFNGTSYQQHFGYSVAGIGDVNGDGRSDVIVGTFRPTAVGYAKVYSGATGAVLWTLNGDTTGDAFGHTVSAAGDVNGDGIPDFAVSAPDANVGAVSRAGKVKIFSGVGAALLQIRAGGLNNTALGYSMSAGHDVNGDQLGELVLGTSVPGSTGRAGQALVVSTMAASAYGIGRGGLETVSLSWTPGSASAVGNGIARVSGAAAGATGILGISGVAADTSLAGIPLFIDITAPSFGWFPIGFDGGGRLDVAVNLRTPAIAGSTIYAQVFELGGGGTVFASNGMLFYFGQ